MKERSCDEEDEKCALAGILQSQATWGFALLLAAFLACINWPQRVHRSSLTFKLRCLSLKCLLACLGTCRTVAKKRKNLGIGFSVHLRTRNLFDTTVLRLKVELITT